MIKLWTLFVSYIAQNIVYYTKQNGFHNIDKLLGIICSTATRVWMRINLVFQAE